MQIVSRRDWDGTALPVVEGSPVGKHSPKRTRSLWRAVGSVLFAILALTLLSGAIVVNTQHWKLEPVLSGSMRPDIQPGDLAIVRPVPVDDIAVGDVIAYQPPDQPRPVLHRIVELDGHSILTRGDANNAPDPWGRITLEGDQVDRLVTAVPKVGYLLNVRGLLLKVIAIIIIAAAGIWIWALIREHQRDTAERDGQRTSRDSPDAASPDPQIYDAPAPHPGSASPAEGGDTTS